MVCAICRERESNAIRYGNMPMCNQCWEKEQAMTAENMSPENQQARVIAQQQVMERSRIENATIEMSQKIDNSITIRSDIFNAKTTAILDLKAAIDNDETIANKPYALAETLKTRFEHLSSVIFDAQQVVMDGANEQKAIQSYLNTLANQLRSEEREKLKLADISYKPQTIKPTVKTVKTTGTKASKVPAHRQKFDKEALKKYATELGVPEFHLQQVVIQQGVTVEKAADIVRAMLQKMRAASGQ